LSTCFVRFPQKGGDSVVSIATGHGLEGPGIESQWGMDFSAPVQTCPGANPVSCTLGTGSFSRIKRLARGVHHPHPPSAEVKGRVQLYLYPLTVPSCQVIVRTLLLLYASHKKQRFFPSTVLNGCSLL